MSLAQKAFKGIDIFDGLVRHRNHALVIEGGKVVSILPEDSVDPAIAVETLVDGILIPGFVDLQVNGGGGVMLNDDPSLGALQRMAKAHSALGATSILPTLITDAPEKTPSAIEAATSAISHGVHGILGLHFEGPHLAVSRCGAHDPNYIRPMTDQDIEILQGAAQKLPVVKVTVAPESVLPEQIASLVSAGIIVSIGHSDATYDQVAQAVAAGASCTTHLFNAMRQMSGREPGVVGAALTHGKLSAGLIADGLHVHPSSIRVAQNSKCGPGRIFLVSDAMAVAGTEDDHFDLGGRVVTRSDGRLSLGNGTLAGADLDLLTAVRNMIRWGIVEEDTAFAMATSIPARIAGLSDGTGRLMPGGPANFQLVSTRERTKGEIWHCGQRITRQLL